MRDMIIVAVDPSCGVHGRTGVAVLHHDHTELFQLTSEADVLDRVPRVGPTPGTRLLAVVERSFANLDRRTGSAELRARVQAALDLEVVASTLAGRLTALGYEVLRPTAVQWRSVLRGWLTVRGEKPPARRDAWKAVAVRYAGQALERNVSEHEAEAFCMAFWAHVTLYAERDALDAAARSAGLEVAG